MTVANTNNQRPLSHKVMAIAAAGLVAGVMLTGTVGCKSMGKDSSTNKASCKANGKCAAKGDCKAKGECKAKDAVK